MFGAIWLANGDFYVTDNENMTMTSIKPVNVWGKKDCDKVVVQTETEYLLVHGYRRYDITKQLTGADHISVNDEYVYAAKGDTLKIFTMPDMAEVSKTYSGDITSLNTDNGLTIETTKAAYGKLNDSNLSLKYYEIEFVDNKLFVKGKHYELPEHFEPISSCANRYVLNLIDKNGRVCYIRVDNGAVKGDKFVEDSFFTQNPVRVNRHWLKSARSVLKDNLIDT